MKKKIENGIKSLRNSKGFTLIELIVVVGIIGILVGIASPRFTGFTKDANASTLEADAKVLETAALVYNIEKEGWPVADPATEVAEATTLKAALTEAKVDIGTGKLVAIDESKKEFTDTVKNTKNKVEEYVIVVGGKHEGRVFHKTGTPNKANEQVYGIDAKTPAKE